MQNPIVAGKLLQPADPVSCHSPPSAQTLACRTTKRSVGASKHNAFSIARFATSEEGPGGPVRENAAGKKWAGVDRDFWEGVADLMPEAVEDHKAKVRKCMNLS